MLINNVELEDINLLDADMADRIDAIRPKLNELAKKEDSTEIKIGNAIREKCTIVNEIFDKVYGEGTAKKVFGEKCNLIISIEALASLVKEIEKATNKMNELTNKYSPNRAMRRSKKNK